MGNLRDCGVRSDPPDRQPLALHHPSEYSETGLPRAVRRTTRSACGMLSQASSSSALTSAAGRKPADRDRMRTNWLSVCPSPIVQPRETRHRTIASAATPSLTPATRSKLLGH